MQPSGCYKCGSSLGDESRLCPSCAEIRRNERASTLDTFRAQIQEPDTTFDLMRDPRAQAAFVVAVVLVAMIYSLLASPFAGKNNGAALAFGVMLGCAALSFATWAFFWMRLVVMEPMWAIASFLFPFFVYRYAIVNWTEREVRFYFVLHAVFVAVTILFGIAASSLSGKSIAEILLIYQLYTQGLNGETPIVLPAEEGIEVPYPE